MSDVVLPQGKLVFAVTLHGRLAGATLPIEVRSRDRRLVGRFLSTDTPTIDAGQYYVSAYLPDSSVLAEWIEVVAGKASTVALESFPTLAFGEKEEASEEQPGDWPSTDHLVVWWGKPGHYAPAVEICLGGLTAGALSVPLPPRVTDDDQLVIQLMEQGRPPIVVVVPRHWRSISAESIELSIAPSRIDAHLYDKEADLLLRYRADVDRAKLMTDVLKARGLLADKAEDPIAAAAGAAALLGMDEASRVTSWIESLARRFPWLPDGPALAAEALAREGRHRAAVEMLLLLEERGLPLFSASLGYALDRLSLYERAREDDIGDRARMRKLRERLEPYARYRVAGRPLTTFFARDPNAPSDRGE